ncbi:MAG: DUF3899 domain-containing protein [Paenisporosarcina sp.]
MRKKIMVFLLLQITIVTFMFIYYRELDLIPYINVSFLVGGILFFIGLIIYVLSNGFFDIFTLSMRKAFTPKRYLNDIDTMRLPSQVIDFPYVPFLRTGGAILLCMAVALVIYYIK